MLHLKEKFKQAPIIKSNILSQNIELDENTTHNIDICLVSDINQSRHFGKYDDEDDDVPMLNPNYEADHAVETNHSPSLLESDHCHVYKEKNTEKKNRVVWRKLITVLILCVIFMILEIIGGIMAQSISIQTDAAHMAADIAGFFFSILALYVSNKEPTRRMSYGYHRSEVLGALFSTLVIWILTGILVYLAVMRVIYQEFDIEPKIMVITASCGIVFNIIMYFVLHTDLCINGIQLKHHGHSHSGDGHGHGHGHGHSHSAKKQSVLNVPINDNFSQIDFEEMRVEDDVPNLADDSNNINLRAAAIHVIGDFIQSVGVLIAAIIIYIKPDYKLADPICTFIFSILVVLTTAPIIKDIFFVLMEALPVNFDYDSVVRDLCNIPNVRKAHNLHIWCLTMDKIALSVHLAIEREADTQEVLAKANQILRSKYKIDRTTIQVEYFKNGMNSCDQCKLPG